MIGSLDLLITGHSGCDPAGSDYSFDRIILHFSGKSKTRYWDDLYKHRRPKNEDRSLTYYFPSV